MEQWKDITQVALPLPFPLKTIHAYVLEGKTGLTIVDTGLHTKETEEVWDRLLAEKNRKWTDIEKIVLTHYHPDHYGFAGRMQQKSGAPVYISKLDSDQAHLFWGKDSTMAFKMAHFYEKHGLKKSLVDQIPEHLKSFVPWVSHPDVTYIAAGETIQMGDREYQILHTPGHADGHLSFWDKERRWLIAGDAILPRITPNISLWPACDPNPLGLYLQTLQNLKELPAEFVFSAHGAVFSELIGRIVQLEKHHARRLQHLLDLLAKQRKVSAATACDSLFGTDLSIHNLRFALSETLAHLEFLVAKGTAKRIEEAEHTFYVIV